MEILSQINWTCVELSDKVRTKNFLIFFLHFGKIKSWSRMQGPLSLIWPAIFNSSFSIEIFVIESDYRLYSSGDTTKPSRDSGLKSECSLSKGKI